jgi:hypothetical protein
MLTPVVFAFQPTNKKGKLLPKVELIPRVIPPLSFNTPAIPLKYRQDNAMQRIQNTYQAGEQVRVLDAVEIAGKKIETLDEKKDIRIYGTPNYTVTGDKLGGTVAGMNLLVALQGKVPGLTGNRADGCRWFSYGKSTDTWGLEFNGRYRAVDSC